MEQANRTDALPHLPASDRFIPGRPKTPEFPAPTGETTPPLEKILGESPAIQQVRRLIAQICRVDVPVLIRGEPGTGKDLVAAAIHYAGGRAGRPFIKFNPAGAPEPPIEGELFGREKGVLPDAPGRRIGRIEAAHGGSLLLDEPGQFSPALQVKLLRAIQDRQFERLGGARVRQADVRFLVATRYDLSAAVAAGAFREDLYYRLSVLPIVLPPLRDRREDILPLVEHFARRFALRGGHPFRRITAAAVDRLMAHPWPGNVRELETVIERALLAADEGTIGPEHLPAALAAHDDRLPLPGSLEARVAELEREMIAHALGRSGGNVRAAARELGITPRIARYKISKLGIDPALFHRRRPA
ncbi:MAG: sigma-54 dependent transcriptional regulator [Planctomycetota bacterium]|nr:sigma-54 dependent transcriptional regulator [Planctomycetota bacterium]